MEVSQSYLSYRRNVISYTGKMTSLYWIRAQIFINGSASSQPMREDITYVFFHCLAREKQWAHAFHALQSTKFILGITGSPHPDAFYKPNVKITSPHWNFTCPPWLLQAFGRWVGVNVVDCLGLHVTGGLSAQSAYNAEKAVMGL